ncbi:MAG: muconolactone Delta-isomerase family protein [Bacteroidota bacterium]
MNQYMVEIILPGEFTQDFAQLIPAQRARINELFGEGSIRSYSLAMDRSLLWVIFVAESTDEVEGFLDSFPIIDYCSHSTHELMFHDMATNELPRISLN